MDNKAKAIMTFAILMTLVATAIFFLLKPTLTRSEHAGTDQMTSGKHLVSGTVEQKKASKGNSIYVKYDDATVQAEVESQGQVMDQKDSEYGKTDDTIEAKLVRTYYQKMGLDDVDKTYTRVLSTNEEEFDVKIVDERLRRQGGSGTIDIVHVDESGNISPINY